MAWQSSGNPVFKARQAISIQRQVMIVAGFLGFLGTALGYLVRPEYYALSAFVGAGLMFAGISGFCGMALLLEKMPWNQINDESCSEPSCAGSCSV
jgi:predicted branched-subunit amino acid permease